MRLLIVDDHEVVRRGVRSLLSDRTGWDVCGEAVDGQEAIDKARELKPDLIVMDVSMPRLNGLDATRQVRTILPECEVLILSQHENSEMARQALKAGARGYVVKSSISRDLLYAVAKASRHEYFFDPAVLDKTPTAHTDVQEILQRSAAFEKALRESEQQLRSLAEYQSAVMNNMAEGLYAVDANGLVTSINRAGEAILGWTKEELLGKKMHDVTHYRHSDGSPFPADECPGLQVAQKGIALREHEDTFIHKNGSFVPVVFSASPLKEDGNITGVIVSFRDDTEQRRARAALHDSREQLVLALESSRAAMFDWDVIQKRGNWNPQMAAIYGFQPENEYITAEEWGKLFHPADAERLRQEAEQFWKTGDEFYFEFRTAPQHGGVKWISSHGRIVRDGNGKAVRMIGTHNDITDRKRAEEVIKQSESRLRAAFSQSYSFLVLLQPDGTIIEANRAALEAAGGDSAKVVGRKFWEPWWSALPEEIAALKKIITRVAGGQSVRDECHFCLPDGTRRIGDRTLSPIFDDAGNVVMIVATGLDITERKQTEMAVATRARQQKALFHLADQLHRAASLDEVYNAALDAILAALQCDRASILLCDNAGIMRFKSWRGLSSEYRAAVDGHSAWKPGDKDPQPVSINDMASADITEPLKSVVKREGIAALAFIPLVSNGTLMGKFMTYFNNPHQFTTDELDLSLTISRQLAYAIDRKRSDEALQRSEERLRNLSESLDAKVSKQTERLRKLTHDLLRTQDEERKHIARELHDSAGQTLAAIGMSLDQTVQEAARLAPNFAKRLEEVQLLVQQLNREVRTTSYLLHPPLLEESGLSSALNWYVQGFGERSCIAVTLDVAENLGRLPNDMELAIFRLVQECLTNIHRHSGSKKADIRMFVEAESVHVEVSDQGKGISPDRLAELQSGGSGVGIKGMKERLRQFGGEMNIASNGSGTSVIVSIPLPKRVGATDAEPFHATV